MSPIKEYPVIEEYPLEKKTSQIKEFPLKPKAKIQEFPSQKEPLSIFGREEEAAANLLRTLISPVTPGIDIPKPTQKRKPGLTIEKVAKEAFPIPTKRGLGTLGLPPTTTIGQVPRQVAKTGVEFTGYGLKPSIIAAGKGLGMAGRTFARTPAGRRFIAKRLPTLGKKLLKSTSEVIDDSTSNVKVIAQNVATGVRKAETELIDRLAPIRHFQAKIESVIGKPLKFDQKPFEAARLFAGIGGKINNRLNILKNIVNPKTRNPLLNIRNQARLPKKVDNLNKLMKLQRMLERAERGFKNPGGITKKQIRKDLVKLSQKVGRQDFNNLRFTAGRIRRELFDTLLQESRDAGIISQEAFAAIKTKNKFYVPFDVLDYMSKNAKLLPQGGKSFNVARQQIIKPLKGTKRDIAQPLDATIRKVFSVVNLNERNKVAQKVLNLSKINPKAKAWIKPFKEGQVVPKGFQRFSAFFNGKKKTYLIPDEVADSIKGISSENIDTITRLASKLGRALRAGATQFNVAFSVPNVVRDVQTAKLVSKVGFNLRDWVRGFASTLRRDKLFRLYEESGAGFSGFFTRYRRTTPAGTKELFPSISKKVTETVNPFKWIANIAETAELSTRVGVFKKGLRTMPSIQAGFNSRNATIDFARMGTKMKFANMWVPFLNARLQGTLNIFKAMKQNPARTAWLGASIVAAPLTATYMWNTTKYPDVWDDISQYEKDNNFIFIHGREKDERNRYLKVAKIPKGDFGRIVGNPIENFLEWTRGTQKKDFQQLAAEVLSDISPIGFEREGKFSATRLLSSIAPPTAKAALEYPTGYSLFLGRKYIPRRFEGVSPEEEYTTTTPESLVKVGQTLGISPLRLQNALGTQFGGVGRGMPYLFTGDIKRGFGLARRFMGAYGGGKVEELFDIADDASRNYKDKRIQLKRRALDIYRQLQKMPPEPKVRRSFIESRIGDNKKLGDAFINLLKAEMEGNEPLDRFIRSLPIKARTSYIIQVIQTFENDDQKIRFLQDLSQKKILTPSVWKEIMGVRKE